jgi:NADH-quinone oxidoreductase subunit M
LIMEMHTLISAMIFLPLLGAIAVYLLGTGPKSERQTIAKSIALITTMVVFGLSLYMWALFDPNTTSPQFVEEYTWFRDYNIAYKVGIDGISLFFVLLTTFLTPLCILASWNITKKIRLYLSLFLVLESAVLGAFCALDMVLFYIFFEAVLIPMYFIIGIWGSDNRVYAAYKFFLYTLLGSVFMLIAVIYIYASAGTSDMMVLNSILPKYPVHIQNMLWLCFFASFAVKVPMFPVHTWLPDAHVQAPTAGSMVLAGILLKLGGYGFLRISLPMLPDASVYFSDFVLVLSIIAVIYTSFVALMQKDMKKLIAYSSVAHMGYVTAGIFVFNHQGIDGAIFQMMSHGIVSAALFLCVGILYDRMHTKEIAAYGGVTNKMSRFALVFMIFMLASVGLPATSGFVGEFMIMMAVFQKDHILSLLIATGMVLGAAYMLWLFARVMFGEATKPEVQNLTDIDMREKIAFVPMLILVFIMGIYPKMITDYTKSSVAKLKTHTEVFIHKLAQK